MRDFFHQQYQSKEGKKPSTKTKYQTPSSRGAFQFWHQCLTPTSPTFRMISRKGEALNPPTQISLWNTLKSLLKYPLNDVFFALPHFNQKSWLKMVKTLQQVIWSELDSRWNNHHDDWRVRFKESKLPNCYLQAGMDFLLKKNGCCHLLNRLVGAVNHVNVLGLKLVPIGSMQWCVYIYTPTFDWFFVVNVGKSTSPVDPMGLGAS